VWNSAVTKITAKAEAAVKELLALSDKDLQEAAGLLLPSQYILFCKAKSMDSPW
jgi:hypothetical protein